MNLDLNLIKVFLAVYNNKSITLAADHLGLSQPTVSASLKRLESVLQRPLFIREGRGIAPSNTAISLAAKLDGVMDTIIYAVKCKSEVRAYCSENMLHILGDINGVQFSESPLGELDVLDALKSKRIDLTVDTFDFKDSSLISENIFQDKVVLVCRKDHPRIQGNISKAQYYQEGHITINLRRSGISPIDFLAVEPLDYRNIKLKASSFSSMLMLTSQCDYIAAMSQTMAALWAKSFDLQVLEMPFALKPIINKLIYHRVYRNDSQHKNIREQIKIKISHIEGLCPKL